MLFYRRPVEAPESCLLAPPLILLVKNLHLNRVQITDLY